MFLRSDQEMFGKRIKEGGCDVGDYEGGREGGGGGRLSYPCVVELGLDADHVAFLFILGAEDLELGCLEGPAVRGGGLLVHDDVA